MYMSPSQPQIDALNTVTEATHPDLSGINGHTISDEFPGEPGASVAASVDLGVALLVRVRVICNTWILYNDCS